MLTTVIPDRIILVRALATVMIVGGLIGGLIACGYAVLRGGAAGFASMGCNGGSCREASVASTSHYELVFDIGLYGGGALAVTGIVTLIAASRLRGANAASRPAMSQGRDFDL